MGTLNFSWVSCFIDLTFLRNIDNHYKRPEHPWIKQFRANFALICHACHSNFVRFQWRRAHIIYCCYFRWYVGTLHATYSFETIFPSVRYDERIWTTSRERISKEWGHFFKNFRHSLEIWRFLAFSGQKWSRNGYFERFFVLFFPTVRSCRSGISEAFCWRKRIEKLWKDEERWRGREAKRGEKSRNYP